MFEVSELPSGKLDISPGQIMQKLIQEQLEELRKRNVTVGSQGHLLKRGASFEIKCILI